MQEELIISGRNLPGIDPHLHIWHWPIYIDLFMGGLAAGLLFFAAYFTLTGKSEKLPTAVKWATFVAPVAICIALICLLIDLKHKLYFWQLYTTFKIMSPMSFGSWVLLFITPLSFLWSFSYLRELFPNLDYKIKLLYSVEAYVIKFRKPIAWALIFLSISLGIYTGILLSAFNARPLWNTALLGPLFLLYGLLTASAVIMLMTRNQEERNTFRKISLVLIGIVLFLLIHLFMGYAAGSEVQISSLEHFMSGEFVFPFWGMVIGLGLLIPGLLELLNSRGVKVPVMITSLLILAGGFIFRVVIVQAGEITRFLY